MSAYLEHLTRCVWRLRITLGADASSRRSQLDTRTKTIRWKLLSSPEKGKARENPARARKVARKAKRVTLGKVTENRKWNTRDLMVSVEIAENTVTRLLIVGISNSTNRKAKVQARASRNPTSQTSVKATRANKRKRRGHQTHLCNRRVCLK